MNSLHDLPSVDQVLRSLQSGNELPREVIVNEVRNALAERREALMAGVPAGAESIEVTVQRRLRALAELSLRPVINATGVILHTNLGRAPLPAFEPIAGYSNLEYDLESGKRGKRDAHIAPLLESLLGKPGIVVNNNAAAVYLVLSELAAGHEVIVSRGELIEIGDGFRIPDIMARSGAILREVGTTNRTRLDDYRRALNENTRLILRVHPSNFRMSGFTSRPAGKDLSVLAREHSIPLYEDLGSGCIFDLRPYGFDEPLVNDSLQAGVDLVSFSCDKLLGGPQAGIVAGNAELIQRVRRNPMYRAFRVDKLILQSLQVTLQRLLIQDWQSIPSLRMIVIPLDDLRRRAERVAEQISEAPLQLRQSESAIGGGSTPGQVLPTWVIELSVPDPIAFERRLRNSPVPVVARIEQDKILVDLRTVRNEEEADLIRAIKAACSAGERS
ncbi:MAG TPA: L-seryl-tRNA(Sec) selenium transferase [Bryobacteraceae bacterium]|nr:L-seryl-tRNA(Sec) selenium transferase [Bryobacteraceae bacterium]